MTKSSHFHLIVFFTYGVSLEEWADKGLLSRELLIYERLVRNGHQVTLITYGNEKDLAFEDHLKGIKVIPGYTYIKKTNNRWANLLRSLLLPFKLSGFLKTGDIFKTNQMSGAWVPLIGGLIYRKPVVVRCGYEMLRNLLRDEKKIYAKVVKAVFGYIFEMIAYIMAKRVILSSTTDKFFVSRFFPVNREKIRCIRNFIDTEKFFLSLRGLKKQNDFSAIFIGRLEPCKNLDNLIMAGALTGCHLDIIGHGSQLDHLKSIAINHNAQVRFLGTIENEKLPHFLNMHDIFVLPSFYECSPKALLEAMACGRIVLGTKVEGIRELIQDGQTGFLCKTDSESIQLAIQRVLDTSEDILRHISQSARRFVISECSIDKVFQKETEIYSELLH